MGAGSGEPVVSSLPREAVTDGAWVGVCRFNGKVEVWRFGIFDEECEVIDAFADYAAEARRMGDEVEFLHAVRLEVDVAGIPGVLVPAQREVLPETTADTGMYAIARTPNAQDRWSNADGWTDGPDFTVFTAEERAQCALPMGGAWVRISTAQA